jgi:hypothetical protein
MPMTSTPAVISVTVMANPPFNVSGVDKEKLKDDPRFRLGLPSTDNANYLWIQTFYSSLNKRVGPDLSWPTPPATRAASGRG